MKIKLKNIEPNPFRDMSLYELDKGKVQDLRSSIRDTGFWDNIVVRKKPDESGKYQLAYGHHRFQAVIDESGLESYIDVPVKDLSDEMMLRIMARENEQDWQMGVKNVDETVRIMRQFLFDNQSVAFKYWDKKDSKYHILKKKLGGGRKIFRTVQELGSELISRFVGGEAWYPRRIRYSFERLDAIKSGEIDKKAVESLPTERAGRDFVRGVKAVKKEGKKVDATAQRRAASKISESRKKKGASIAGEIKIKHAIREEVTGKKAKEKVVKLESYIDEARKLADKLTYKNNQLIEYKDVFDSDIYRKSLERRMFETSVFKLIESLRALFGEKGMKLLKEGGKKNEK